MKKLFIVIVVWAGLWLLFFKESPIVLGPGVMAPNTPIQTEIQSPVKFEFKGATFTPLANFDITAKVLGIENYRFDSSAELSPVDFAMGWGKMSDESVLKSIEITQSGRWYRWRTGKLPIPRREIETNSANMHLIPASDDVESDLEEVETGQVVRLVGKLVELVKPNGWHWKSSLTRNDSGAHACEVIFVEKVQVPDLSLK